MSMQAALKFIRHSRQDETLRAKIQALPVETDLENLTQIGVQDGFEFTVEELQTAFKYDWSLRWFHYKSKRDYQTST
jgi:predicted ribosomally synthesized peptide with nif11-like leader